MATDRLERDDQATSGEVAVHRSIAQVRCRRTSASSRRARSATRSRRVVAGARWEPALRRRQTAASCVSARSASSRSSRTVAAAGERAGTGEQGLDGVRGCDGPPCRPRSRAERHRRCAGRGWPRPCHRRNGRLRDASRRPRPGRSSKAPASWASRMSRSVKDSQLGAVRSWPSASRRMRGSDARGVVGSHPPMLARVRCGPPRVSAGAGSDGASLLGSELALQATDGAGRAAGPSCVWDEEGGAAVGAAEEALVAARRSRRWAWLRRLMSVVCGGAMKHSGSFRPAAPRVGVRSAGQVWVCHSTHPVEERPIMWGLASAGARRNIRCSTARGSGCRASVAHLFESCPATMVRVPCGHERYDPRRAARTPAIAEADALLASDPMALLIGFVLDQQVSVAEGLQRSARAAPSGGHHRRGRAGSHGPR